MTVLTARSGERAGQQWIQEWAPLGNCVTQDPDALFVQGAAQQQAKQICVGCPVIAECLADALDNRSQNSHVESLPVFTRKGRCSSVRDTWLVRGVTVDHKD